MKAADVKLRREIYRDDAWKIIDWMKDEEITRFLNEHKNISGQIKQVINRINLPILTHLFNQNGSFFMVTAEEKAIGFLRLVSQQTSAEIVIVIGDRDKWGMGFGSRAILQGLKHAFFEWRVNKVIANIHAQNLRSINVFKKIGFKREKESQEEIRYSITLKEFLGLIA